MCLKKEHITALKRGMYMNIEENKRDYGRVRIDVPLRQNETQADYHTEKTLNTVQVSADVAVMDATIRTGGSAEKSGWACIQRRE